MLKSMKHIYLERIRKADSRPLFCPTCNKYRRTKELRLSSKADSIVCSTCLANVCMITEGPGPLIYISEVTAPEPSYMCR